MPKSRVLPFPQGNLNLVTAYLKAKEQLQSAQALERSLRFALVALVDDDTWTRGSRNYLAGPNKITVTKSLNYSVNQDSANELFAEKIDMTEVFRHKWELKPGAYEALPHNKLIIFSDTVTSKPGTPNVKIEPTQ